jgi:Flp pilus assembly protein TadD
LAEAERHFRLALALNSATAMAHFYYGRWLQENGRDREAVEHLVAAIVSSPADLEARHLLLGVYERLGDRERACALANATLTVVPGDSNAAAAVKRLCAGR